MLLFHLLAAALPITASAGGETSGAAAEAAPALTCEAGKCRISLTPAMMLKVADHLVATRRFAEAKPYLEALDAVPEFDMERQFLEGYVAAETGDLKTAEARFRSVLSLRPDMTRARLELARVLMLQKKDRAADYHFWLAQDDPSLDPAVRRTVYAARGIIRDRRRWSFSIGFGLAPDTNINNATSDRTVDVLFGDVTLPFVLSPESRKSTGVGQTISLSAEARVPVAPDLSITGRADGYGVNYKGTFADDVAMLLAVGPDLRVDGSSRVSVETLFGQRWYAGDIANQQAGIRLSGDKRWEDSSGLGIELEARHSDFRLNDGFDGWTYSVRVAHERVLAKSLIATASIFARRDVLASEAYSSRELGLSGGIGGELPMGFNLGISAQLSKARYDAPLPILGNDARNDSRFATRVYAANRRIRFKEFSPSISYTFTNNASNLGLYDFTRHRLELQITRIF